MPGLVEGSEASAHLKPEIAGAWGLGGRTIPIAGGGGDNAASAIGVGATEPGAGFVSLGTSGVIFSVTDRFVRLPERTLHAFCHALPHRWHGMAVMLSAASSLSWIASVLGRESDIGALIASAAAFAESKGAVASAPIFLPYLSGERTPHNNAGARGSFVGLSHLSDQARLAQAVMEGVTFAFRDCQRVLKDAGTTFERLLAVGGGSKSPLWLKLIATNLDTEIALPEDGDFGGALGAARLGLCAAEGADPADVMSMPGIREIIKPDASLRDAYTAQYARYRALYPAIEEARK